MADNKITLDPFKIMNQQVRIEHHGFDPTGKVIIHLICRQLDGTTTKHTDLSLAAYDTLTINMPIDLTRTGPNNPFDMQ